MASGKRLASHCGECYVAAAFDMATLEITNDLTDLEIGDLGESEFGTWCIRAGITANPVSKDRKGWDFVIELPAENPRFRYDEITAKVQVKATKSGADGARIKLDNLGRMATDPAPWFIVYFDFDDAGTIREVYLVHVDEEFVRNAHHTLTSNAASTLHQQRIKIKWAPADRLDPREPTELSRRIRAVIGGSMWDYNEKKERWNIAAFTRFITCALSIPGTREEAFESLADLAIGLVDEVPAEVSQLVDAETRQNVLPEGAVIQSSVISIERRPPEQATFAVVAGSESVVVPCGMYSSAAFATAIPIEHHKIRFFTDLLSLILMPNGIGLHVDVPPKRVSLASIARAARAMRLMTQPGAKVTVQTIGIDQTVSIAGYTPTGWTDFVKAIAWERAALLGTEMGLPAQLQVYPSLILAQSEQVNALYVVMDGSRSPSALEIGITDKKAAGTKKTAVLLVPKIALGDYGIFAVAAILGVATFRQGKLVIKKPRIEVVSNEVRPRKDLTNEFFERRLREAVIGLKRQSFTTVVVSASKLEDKDEPSPS